MAKKGFWFKDSQGGGGWKDYMYKRKGTKGNAKALVEVRAAVQKACSGIKEVGARRTCFATTALEFKKGGGAVKRSK